MYIVYLFYESPVQLSVMFRAFCKELVLSYHILRLHSIM